MGQVVHTLPQGPSVKGVTSLDDEIYLLRDKEHDQIEVYNVTTFLLLRCLDVPNCREVDDMTICKHVRCLYISDHIAVCVHKVGLHDGATRWTVHDKPAGLSVNNAHNVLVTCRFVRKIKEFSSNGNLLREVTLPDDVINPWHAIQLTSGQFIVSR